MFILGILGTQFLNEYENWFCEKCINTSKSIAGFVFHFRQCKGGEKKNPPSEYIRRGNVIGKMGMISGMKLLRKQLYELHGYYNLLLEFGFCPVFIVMP